jgi:hypothetical protein
LCALGNDIEGSLATANEQPTTDGFNIGGINTKQRIRVTLDGVQATPGTGLIPIGGIVVAGTLVPRGTALGSALPKVCLATTPANVVSKWRLVSSSSATGVVGATGMIERI